MAQTLRTGLSARVVAYTGVWLILAVSVAVLLAGRRDLDVLILRQPGTLYTTITGGDMANFYTVQALNRTGRSRAFTIEVVEPHGATIVEPGRARRRRRLRAGGKPRHAAPPARLTSREPNTPIQFAVRADDGVVQTVDIVVRRSGADGNESTAGTGHGARTTMSIKLNWGTGIALVYAIFAAATTGFVTFAMNRSVDLVSNDYYTQALRQDERMQAERNTQALQPAPSVARSGPGAIVLSLPAGPRRDRERDDHLV